MHKSAYFTVKTGRKASTNQDVMFVQVNEKEPFQIPLAAPRCERKLGTSESLPLHRVFVLALWFVFTRQESLVLASLFKTRLKAVILLNLK